MFCSVARRASNHDVADVVAASSAQRDDVIGVPGVSCVLKFALTVVALPFLALELFAELCGCVLARSLLPACSTIMRISTFRNDAVLCLIVVLFIAQSFYLVL